MTRKRPRLLSSLQSRFIAVYLIVMAPIAILAGYYQFNILTDRYKARETAALDALEIASSDVTATMRNTSLLLDVLNELSSQSLPVKQVCEMLIGSVVDARIPVVAAGIYRSDGRVLCTNGVFRADIVATISSARISDGAMLNLSDRNLTVTNVIEGRVIAIEAELPSVALPEFANDYTLISNRDGHTEKLGRDIHQDLRKMPTPDGRDIVQSPSGQDVAVLPSAAFGIRFYATLKPGVDAPPMWLTTINASMIPVLLLAGSLLLADLLIRKMALSDITQLTREMRAFRQNRDLPKTSENLWASNETVAMRAEFSALSEQLLHEEAEAQNSLHNAKTLQREIFHRVGNNLQIIQSILRLYAKEAQSPEENQLVARLTARIRLINLVHNTMHQTANAPLLPVGSALGKLVQGLRHEGMIDDDMEVLETYEPVQLRLSRTYALCYLIAETLDRLSRSGARNVTIAIMQDGDKAHLLISGDTPHLASADSVNAQLRQVYQHELNATANWREKDDSVLFEAFLPREVT